MSPLQDRIASMFHPLLDASRKGAVRDLAWDVGAMEARVAELEAENKALRAAGDALARHVAEDSRGQTARRLVEAWAEVSR